MESGCMRIAPEAVREASVIMVNGVEISGIERTGWERKQDWRVRNTVSQVGVHAQAEDFLVRSVRGRAMEEKLGMNF